MKKLLIFALGLGSLAWAQQVYPPDPAGGGVPWESSGVTALTSGVATEFLTLAIAQGDVAGGRIEGVIECSDASDVAVLKFADVFGCYNDAGTEGCTLTDDPHFAQAGSGGSSTAGTMTYVAGTDEVTFRWNGTCTLTETTLNLHWSIIQPATATGEVTLP